MPFHRRRWTLSLAATALFLLSACGFHPLYGSGGEGKGGGAEAELATIRIDTIADRAGQKLRNYLIDDLQGDGVPPPAEHELAITYNETQADLGLSNDAITTRGQLSWSVTFQLRNIKTGQIELTNSAQQITAYNIQTSEFATILSRDDAEDRALRAVADNLETRLALYFRNLRLHPPKPAAAPAAAAPTGAPASATTTSTPSELPTQTATPFATHAPGQALDNQSPITQTP